MGTQPETVDTDKERLKWLVSPTRPKALSITISASPLARAHELIE